MSDTFHHGLSVTERTSLTRALATVKTSTIGLVAHAADADADVFPVNTPVLLTDVKAAVAKAGVAGTLATSLSAIAAQTQPLVVVVRVAPGANAGELEDNAIAGIAKLATAPSVLGQRPRILGAPGIDTQEVVGELISAAQKLRGMVYASCGAADTIAEGATYRAEFSQRELMLIYGDFKNGGATRSAVAVALGLRARIDEEMGWNKTLSNVGVNGVTGLTLPVSWDLQDADTDAGVLNAAQVTALIRTSAGYRFWGNRTCADDEAYAFESTVRTNQVLRDTIADGVMTFMDRPLSPGLARDILETINAKFRNLKTRGLIMGAEAYLDTELNTSDQLFGGKLSISYDYTPTSPLEHLELLPTLTDKYYADFGSLTAA